MDVSPLIVEAPVTIDRNATVGKLRGAFGDPAMKAVPITNDDQIVGVVTRRDLLSSHEVPGRKAETLMRSVPTLEGDENVREAARLMLTSDSPILPVAANGTIPRIVRADDLIAHVKNSYDTIEASDLVSEDLIALTPHTTLGKALATFRNHRVRHLPILDRDRSTAVGMLSLFDVLDFVAREVDRTQGGDPDAARAQSDHHGGYGSREGERKELLELPVSNVMTTPVASVPANHPGDELADEMLERGISSVLVTDEEVPVGIVTTSDLLEALTWEDEQPYYIHVHGSDLMTELTWERLSERIASVARKDQSLRLLEAKVHFHQHKEKLRGRPLVLARVRMFTDQGLFAADGEGYGDRHAFGEAIDVVERQIIDGKVPTREERTPIGRPPEPWTPEDESEIEP